MTLRVAELLEERGMTVYQLVKLSDGHISHSTAYRLANNQVQRVSAETVAALCRVFGLKHPGPLFARD